VATTLLHRQVNIDAQLATARDIAAQLRARAAAPVLAQGVAALFASNDGLAPIVELFNWAHQKTKTIPTVEQLRDDLIELLRICGQIGRHCTQATVHPEHAIEPFDGDAIADRLDVIAIRLSQESARLHSLHEVRPVVIEVSENCTA
jgi:ribosomal 50S subunit-associated protein YjgA (DUF615 family)